MWSGLAHWETTTGKVVRVFTWTTSLHCVCESASRRLKRGSWDLVALLLGHHEEAFALTGVVSPGAVALASIGTDTVTFGFCCVRHWSDSSARENQTGRGSSD